jgi:hypothetical protein
MVTTGYHPPQTRTPNTLLTYRPWIEKMLMNSNLSSIHPGYHEILGANLLSAVHNVNCLLSLFLAIDPHCPFQRGALRCHEEIEMDNMKVFAGVIANDRQSVEWWQPSVDSAKLSDVGSLSSWRALITMP